MAMKTKDLKYDILSIEERAVASKNAGNEVINGCIGMLYDENKNLKRFKEVDKHIESRMTSYLDYPAVLGSPSYKVGVLKWVFRDAYENLNAKYNISFCTTLGGTGAISMTFDYVSKHGGSLVLSNVFWPNYSNIADQSSLTLRKHQLIDEKLEFNFKDLKEKLDESLIKYKNVLYVLNDPCQNPTGFSLKKDDYFKLFELLNSYDGKVSLLLDIAYMDYAPCGFFFKDEAMSHLMKFRTYLTYSTSKSFGLYGLRLGGLIVIQPSNNKDDNLQDFIKAYARSTYSCPNNGAMGPVSELLNDEQFCQKIRKEIEEERNRIFKMGNYLISILDSIGIKHFPYAGGFYIAIFVDNAFEYCKKLEAQNIFFSPINDKMIRIAVCSLNYEEINKLKERLK